MAIKRRSRRNRGQSLAELALTLPVVLLLLLVALDFGRVFLGYINLNNAAKVAANFAAQNPTAWTSADPDARDEYQRLVGSDAAGTNCSMPTPIPTPQFPGGTDIGAAAQVDFTCSFSLITPLIGDIVGDSLNVSVRAVFPIRSGVIEGIPVAPIPPTPTPVPTPTATPTPAATPTPGATPSPTPVPLCTVPNLVGTNTKDADRAWGPQGQGAGFRTPVIFDPAVGNGNNNNYIIGSQSLNPGDQLPCSGTAITVYD